MQNTCLNDQRPLVKYTCITFLFPPQVNKQAFVKALLSSFRKQGTSYPASSAGRQASETIYQLIDLKLLPELSLEAFKKLLNSTIEPLNNRTIILSETDILFPLGTPPFLYLQHLKEQHLHSSFIFLIQQNLLTERLHKRFFKIPILFEEIIYVPLDPKNLPFHNKLQAKNFFLSLNENQRLILRLLVRGSQEIPAQLAPDQEYLEKLKIVQKHYGRWQLISPLLEQAALEITSQTAERLSLKNQKIYIGRENISRQFSPTQQKIITLLLKAKGRIVSRERMAKELWGKDWEEVYSDWAIDQMISKLRKKLSLLWINPEILGAKKKKGFLIIN